MFAGEFSSSLFLKVFVYVLLATLIIIYVVAIELGQEPNPITWISACADHYPQFIFFRISTISGSVLLALGWMTNYYYLRTVAKQNIFNIKKYRPEIGMILGMMGAMLLMGSTANIDTGVHRSKWHTSCASSFFVMTYFAIIYNTAISWIIQLKTNALNSFNLYAKTIITILFFIQIFINSSSLEEGEQVDAFKSDIGIILQWTATFTLAAYLYVMSRDVHPFRFVFQLTASESY